MIDSFLAAFGSACSLEALIANFVGVALVFYDATDVKPRGGGIQSAVFQAPYLVGNKLLPALVTEHMVDAVDGFRHVRLVLPPREVVPLHGTEHRVVSRRGRL